MVAEAWEDVNSGILSECRFESLCDNVGVVCDLLVGVRPHVVRRVVADPRDEFDIILVRSNLFKHIHQCYDRNVAVVVAPFAS